MDKNRRFEPNRDAKMPETTVLERLIPLIRRGRIFTMRPPLILLRL